MAAVFSVVEPLAPPAMSTLPLARSVALCSLRAALRLAAAVQVPALTE
jgi:hypothetical protein